MFGIGMPELIVILVVALIIFGPKNLPQIGKAIGNAIHEFKKASSGIQEETTDEQKNDEPKS